MSNVSRIKQSTRNQLRGLKNVLTKTKYDTFKDKLSSAVRKSTVMKLQAKLTKIENDNNEFKAFKQELLSTLRQPGISIDKRVFTNINRSKTMKTLEKHYDTYVPKKTIYLSGNGLVRTERGQERNSYMHHLISPSKYLLASVHPT